MNFKKFQKNLFFIGTKNCQKLWYFEAFKKSSTNDFLPPDSTTAFIKAYTIYVRQP